jgi:tetratricopeptide (TPR) repeat protein
MSIFSNIHSIALVLLLTLTPIIPSLHAAAPSPQDKYLQLYLRLQEAEKLEREEQKASAYKLYSEVLSLLQALKDAYPTWEEGIVNYRIRYCQDKIRLLQNAKDRIPTATPPPPSPPSEIIIESTPQPEIKPPPSPPPSALKHTAPAPSKIQALEEELALTKQRLSQAQNEINILRTRLQATEKQLVMSRSTDLDERLASILQENSQLKNQLNETERQLRALATSSPQSDSPSPPRATQATLANLQSQLRKVQEKLALTEQENNAFRQTTTELKKQLESAQNNLISAQKANLSQRDNESFQRENEVLRDIITRQIQEQARRDAAKKLATEEIENLKIQSAVLRQQLEILASPIINLSQDQLSLLRLPSQINISGERQPTSYTDPTKATPPPESTPSIDPAIEYRSKARIPEDVRSLAQQASTAFSQNQYDEAIAAYQQIIQKYPESLYAWSNLGVAYFQKQDFPNAQTALKQAIRLNPADAFSYSMLGIVYYQIGEYDLAIEHLTRATALEPNDPRTRNYLGIACSQKGWQEAAEKECRRAIELDPNYGDAHFNLAVIYATQRPPAKELARRHYKIALDLGIPKDDKLEKLIQ